jgi:hypothetical protein
MNNLGEMGAVAGDNGGVRGTERARNGAGTENERIRNAR